MTRTTIPIPNLTSILLSEFGTYRLTVDLIASAKVNTTNNRIAKNIVVVVRLTEDLNSEFIWL